MPSQLEIPPASQPLVSTTSVDWQALGKSADTPHPLGTKAATDEILRGIPNVPLVIYHSDCNDGLTAAWVACKYLKDHTGVTPDLYAAKYQTPPPDVTGLDVLICDFSYKRPVLLEMAKVARHISIFDHHKSAQEDLKDIEKEMSNIRVVFDMNRSGAGITWDELYFLGRDKEGPVSVPRPWFVDYVEDNDLWRHMLPECKAVMEYIRSFPAIEHFAMYDRWISPTITRDECGPPAEVVAQGQAILRAKQILVEQTMTTAHLVRLLLPGEGGPDSITASLVEVYACNVPFFLSSEVGHALSVKNAADQRMAIGLTYYRQKDGRYSLSFRSDRDNGDVDVSKIALQFGGGGHRNAAGATVDRLPWA